MARPKINPFTGRKVTAPIAAFTMACILFVYARTSIQAAKRNAQKHREADGGQINWHNESLRRHGKLEPPEEQSTVGQLVGIAKEKGGARKGGEGMGGETDSEKRVREMVVGRGRS